LYANVRPCVAYHPYIDTLHPGMDVVIVRENEEDCYAGIEHRQSQDTMQCLKLISRGGSERIVRYAFEYARAYKRKKVTCFMKDNIMKLTDGLFHKVFDEIGTEYPDIEKEAWIVDIGAAKMADTPKAFDVIVMPNLYGDILSDVAAQIAGSVGLAGSANIGAKYAMFEAIHGSAPRRAGQNLANPSGLLLGAVMMLVHIDQADIAERVHNAWLKTIEDGIHTYDIFVEGVSKQKVGTKEFAQAVAARMGQKPENLTPVSYASAPKQAVGAAAAAKAPEKKALVGADVFLDWNGCADDLGSALSKVQGGDFTLTMIDNRGVKVWPGGFSDTLTGDVWRCRFEGASDAKTVTHAQVVALLDRVGKANFDFVKFEGLYTFDGKPGYSLGQGQ
jgi:isocitrate dehydrogenase